MGVGKSRREWGEGRAGVVAEITEHSRDMAGKETVEDVCGCVISGPWE